MYLTKKEWINMYTTGDYDYTNPDVIKFIANILYHNDNNYNGSDGMSEDIRYLFRSGFCYYFAKMLKDAFGRGEVCWVRNISHIVWRDIDGVLYDIEGPYIDTDDVLPAEFSLGRMLDTFKHVIEEEFKSISEDFSNWVQSLDLNKQYRKHDLWMTEKIYEVMCKDKRVTVDDSMCLELNVLKYWEEYKDELKVKLEKGELQ